MLGWKRLLGRSDSSWSLYKACFACLTCWISQWGREGKQCRRKRRELLCQCISKRSAENAEILTHHRLHLLNRVLGCQLLGWESTRWQPVKSWRCAKPWSTHLGTRCRGLWSYVWFLSLSRGACSSQSEVPEWSWLVIDNSYGAEHTSQLKELSRLSSQ